MMVIPTILYVLLAISFLDRIIAEEAAARATTTFNVEKFKEKLAAALNVTKNSVKEIANEWQISKYPKFLKSAFMHKSAWETMKWKFMKKILTQQVTGKQQAFVASFSGSSVTAGHDSHFNFSTPVVTGKYLQAAFDSLEMKVDSRNIALGNNPCMPYDICIKFFAGYDADVVHWEQNYFCDGNPIVEQFIRQAMTIPTRPIVIFGESNTAHWSKTECKPPRKLTADEENLLKANPETLVSELNKDEFHRVWQVVANIAKDYHGAAIQTFSHTTHGDYACQGPYVATWMEGAASWHPSVIAHRNRAAHHAYFWLLILEQAIHEILISKRAPDAHLRDVETHLDNNYKAMQPKPSYNVKNFIDNQFCYTDYEPRSVREVSLKDLVISGLAKEKTDPGWKFTIYEDIVDKALVKRSKQMGYLDYKYLIYSDDTSGPLSVRLAINTEGPVMICQTPGIWGSLPPGFSKLWEANLEVYVTFDVPDYAAFTFDKEKAKAQTLYYEKDLDLCVKVMPSASDKTGNYPKGKHVLTLVTPPKKQVIFAWLLTPS